MVNVKPRQKRSEQECWWHWNTYRPTYWMRSLLSDTCKAEARFLIVLELMWRTNLQTYPLPLLCKTEIPWYMERNKAVTSRAAGFHEVALATQRITRDRTERLDGEISVTHNIRLGKSLRKKEIHSVTFVVSVQNCSVFLQIFVAIIC
jgi:hypothetical protein